MLAALLVRRAPGWTGSASPPGPPTLPVVFVRPLPQIVPPPATAPEPAARESSVQAPPSGPGEKTRPRRPDLVFVIDDPEDADPGTPRVAGAAGVSLPEVAAESLEDALRIGQMPRTGWVVLRVLVRQDGSAGEIEVQEGGDAAAAARMAPAVQALRFRPALHRGRPVDAWFTLVWPPQ